MATPTKYSYHVEPKALEVNDRPRRFLQAFAAVLDDLKKEPETPSLFINTYNSVDIYSKLPRICNLGPVPPAMRRFVRGY